MGSIFSLGCRKRKKTLSTEILDLYDRLLKDGRMYTKNRNATMRMKIIEHFGQCQACDYPLVHTRNSYTLEGAHTLPKQPDGKYSTSPYNILCLCANCHRLYDNGTMEQSLGIAAKVARNYPNILYAWPFNVPYPCIHINCC